MRHNNLLVAGIGKAKGRAAPGRVRDREAAALAGGGGADLRSKLGEPPILDAAWCSPHARKTLTGGFNKLTPAHRADLHPAPSRARTIALYSSSVCRTFSSSTRSEAHTSELQSLMRISYSVFCLKKKNTTAAITSQKYIKMTTK